MLLTLRAPSLRLCSGISNHPRRLLASSAAEEAKKITTPTNHNFNWKSTGARTPQTAGQMLRPKY